MVRKYCIVKETEYGRLNAALCPVEGIVFYIEVDDEQVYLSPSIAHLQETDSSYVQGVNISSTILHIKDFNQLIRIRKIFDKYQFLVSTFYDITIDFEKRNPYKKADIQLLLALPLNDLQRNRLTAILKSFTYIYLIKDNKTGLIKIGRSNEPQERLKALIRQATLMPEANDFELIYFWEDFEWTEQFIHEKLKDKRVRGEWFSLSVEDVDLIKRFHFWR